MQSTGLEVLRDSRAASRRNETARIGFLLRQRRTLKYRPFWGCRTQARPDQLRRDVERQAAKQTQPHRGRESDEELTLTVVHPTARSR